MTKVWDLPLRIWHWAFAGLLVFSLYTGLAGEISLMDWHQRSGIAVLGLVGFRLAWGLWGGRYARLRYYWTTPALIFAHFRGNVREPHTAPGVALVVLLVIAVAAQAITGLMATDDIFNEGPLVSFVESDTARLMTRIHHRVFWVILALVATHLSAHVVYALRKDPTPLSMFTGKKPVALESVEGRYLRGGVTFAVAAALVWWAYSAL